MNKINQITGREKRELELCENEKEFLSELNTYIPYLLNSLWEQPKKIASIIENAKIEDIKTHLAPLFVNNFYENIFSSKTIEDNLMLVLTLLIQNEINNLKNIDNKDKFLDNTPGGIMLKELINNVEVQKYFEHITKSAIENLDMNNQSYKITFTPDDINKFLNEKSNLKNDTNLKYPSGDNNSDDEDSEIRIKDKRKEQAEQEDFNKNYIPNLDIYAFKTLLEECKNDKNMYDYITSKMRNCEKK